ncbi:glycine/betaine ABC transporter substrate-binding protein [Gordonibacter sp. An230]|nr:glycine/betaine ABC transporter substrate-binding protein [Gordonibacter sp. An230]
MLTLFSEKREWFFELLMQHVAISLASVLMAAVIGLALGIAIAQWRRGAKPVLALVNFVYTIPSIALFGFLIPVTGIGDLTAIVALTVYALLPMVRNTYTGLTTIEPAVVEAARGMGSTDRQLLYRVELPLAAPVIMGGIRNMTTMTIALTGIASFIGAGGLGVAIYRGITTNNLAMTLAGSVLIAALAIVVDLVLGLAEKRTRRHLEPSRARRRSRAPLEARSSNPFGSRRSVLAAAALAVALVMMTGGAFAYSQRGSLFADGSAGGIADSGTVTIATKPMTEQYILSEMLKTLIEKDTDLSVNIVPGIGGGTYNIHTGMERGDFDLYPEYTGTAWTTVLKRDGLYDESMFSELAQAYRDQFDFEWIGKYGFNNTFGIAVRKDVAERYNLRTYSDLAKVAGDLTFGAQPDFYDREDGYPGLQETYGMNFGTTADMDMSLKFQALFDGQVDAITMSTTDGQVTDERLVVLEDDRHFYPSYRCCNVVREDTLQAHPELRDELLKLEGAISDIDMAAMNSQVETQGTEPKDVADAFLAERGLI